MAEDDKVRKLAIAIVNGLIASGEAEQWENADSFVALTTNDETHDIGLNGSFTNVTDALAWAEQHEESLNTGLAPSDAPFVVMVFPMQLPS